MIESYDQLKAFLSSQKGMNMFHIYKASMLITIIKAGGCANKEEIARDFMLRDQDQIDYYKGKVVHPQPGVRLVRDGLLTYNRGLGLYTLNGVISRLNDEQIREVVTILEQRIAERFAIRNNPFGDSNNDAVRGSVRYEVLRRASDRCELCGISRQEIQIDVDHVVPRSKGGSNDLSNLQALCRTCNAQKRDRDDTDFREIAESYKHREEGCLFCSPDRNPVAENELAYAIRDGFPVTEHHTLIIPKRHVVDYFDLYQPELNAINQLLNEQKQSIQNQDALVTAFNIGINSGEDAGQTIFHCHVHLIPRRKGDVEKPKGGVRGVIPGAQSY